MDLAPLLRALPTLRRVTLDDDHSAFISRSTEFLAQRARFEQQQLEGVAGAVATDTVAESATAGSASAGGSSLVALASLQHFDGAQMTLLRPDMCLSGISFPALTFAALPGPQARHFGPLLSRAPRLASLAVTLREEQLVRNLIATEEVRHPGLRHIEASHCAACRRSCVPLPLTPA